MLRNLTDNELLALDTELAFRHIYDRYWESLYKKALCRLNNSEDAQDVVQEIFISLWRNKSRIQIEETLAPYLFTALRYAIIKLVYRKVKKEILQPLSILDLEKYATGVYEHLEYKDLKASIDCEVSHLPQRMKQIYQLSREMQLRNAEIAELLNISEQTVKNTLTVTLKRLRSRIASLLLSILIFFSLFF